MTSPSRRASVRGINRLLLAVLALLGLSSGLAVEALGQCSIVTGPTALTCAGCTNPVTSPAKGFTTVAPYVGLYRNSAGADRLLAPMTWGWVLYDLSSPAFPSEIKIYDLRDPGPPGFPRQDGQSYGPGYFVSSDGQRVVNSLALSTGETVISIPNPAGETSKPPFLARGDTGLQNAIVAVQKKGNRYIVYGMTTRNFFAADITDLTGFSQANPIPSDRSFSLGSTGGTLDLADGGTKQYLYSFDRSGAIVVDISNPGAAPNITSGFVKNSIPTSAFGLPGKTLRGVTAAVDPATGKLYVLGSFVDNPAAASPIPSFSLVLYDPATLQATLVGTPYTTPFEVNAPSFNVEGSPNGGAMAVNPSGDVWAFMWVRSSSLGAFRLYATSARNFGSPITQSADVSGPTGSITGTTFLFKGQQDVYAYFLDGTGPWATRLSCQSGPVAATGRLSVSNVSSGSPVALASGATVFVGDTLSVTPSVVPPNSAVPVTEWNLDLDYHAGTETGAIGVMQLSFPDACLNGCFNAFTSNPDPPSFTLVGPCDFRKSGVPASGTGCWASVGPGPTGNGDFASVTTATLPIAFEASNALNTTTVPLATFNIVWKVPAVKVQSLSALLISGSATFTDGSEGHPIPAGYKWYFGGDPAAPSGERLLPACTVSPCQVVFPGKGTYNAWLTASYNGGYSSPDCVQPCGGATGSFKVTVTDFVAAFTAPSSAIINTPIGITNNSQKGLGVTGDSYAYTLCDATAGPCTDLNYQPITGMGAPPSAGTIGAPATGGTFWLRIMATYNGGSTAQWLPNVVANYPDVWPITVTTQPPVVAPTAGYGFCTVGGCTWPYTGTVGTPITVNLTLGGVPMAGTFSWSVSGAGSNPASGTGNTFTFTPTASGTAVVSVLNFTPTPSPTGFLVSGGSPPPPPPAGLSVSVSTSNASPTAGTEITLSANPSGGSGTYTTFSWDFNDGSPSSSLRTVNHTYANAGSYTPACLVHDSLGASASGNRFISVQAPAAPTNSILPTAGTTNCVFQGCTAPYSGNAGTPITLAAFQSGTQLTDNYSWTVTGTGVNPSPASGSGTTFTFTPLGPGTATVTNTTLAVNVKIFITGTVQVPDFILSDAVRGNIPQGTDGSFLVVKGRSTTFTAVAQGTTTPLAGTISWDFGDGNSSNLNPAHNTFSTLDPHFVFLTFLGQTVHHAVFTVEGIPTGAYSSVYADGGPLDPNRVDPSRTILFQAAENFAATYSWNFNDGTGPQTGHDVNHSFAAPGSYTVILTETLGANTFTTAVPTTFVASIAPVWIVPGLAYAKGVLPGSFYVSDVVIENPHTSQEMSLKLGLADGTAPASIVWRSLVLQPMESRTQSNILQTVFGKAPGGPATALVVKGDSLPANTVPVIWASTYNNNGGDPTKGTFGVAIPAVPLSGAISQASSGPLTEFPGLRDVAPPPLVSVPNVSPAYTNVGFVNAGDIAATLKVNFYSSRAESLFQKLGDEVVLSLGPNETRQLTQALTKRSPLGAGWDPTHPAENYFMAVNVTEGDKVIPYTTVKDIGSSDSVFSTSDGTLSTSYRVPAVVRAHGQNQTNFLSRLILFNPSGSSRTVQLGLSFLKCDPNGGTCGDRQVTTGNLKLASGQTIIYEDFVKEWLAAHDVTVHEDQDYTTSFVDVSPADLNTDPILVRAETYNATPAGNFGTQVPGLVASIHGASTAPGGPGSRLLIPRAFPNGGVTGFRTNVAFVLLSGTSGTAKVRVYPDTGGLPALPEVSISLTAGEPFLQRSLEKLFPGINLFGTSNKYSLEIVVTDGTIGAYASINDNVTGDSTMMVGRPQR